MKIANYTISSLCATHMIKQMAKVGQNVKVRFELNEPVKRSFEVEDLTPTLAALPDTDQEVSAESLWVYITDVIEGDTIEDTVYIGYINNDPVYISSKYKDEVELRQSEIAMILTDEGVIGPDDGHTH